MGTGRRHLQGSVLASGLFLLGLASCGGAPSLMSPIPDVGSVRDFRSAADLPAGSDALLERGSRRVRGLPGFGPNAFNALYGEYRFGEGGVPVRVWATDEALYFSDKLWRSERTGAGVLYASVDGGLWAASPEAFPALRTWSLFISIDAETAPGPAERDRFIRTVLNRFSYYLSGAKTPTDVSLPAILEL